MPITYAGIQVSWLPDPVAICLYRVLREAPAIVAKHARATRIRVTLWADAPSVTLSVENDGQGFDSSVMRSPRNHGDNLGLLGVRGRLELLGGRLENVSPPDVPRHI